jgi:tetratricopeptide (TPR) repeat protein
MGRNIMLRAMAGIVAFVSLSAGAQAATEADRRDCATHQDSEAKIAACTRIADDKSSSPSLLTLAYRNRGIAYGNKGLHELANFDFSEALKLSPEDRASLYGRGRSFLQMARHDRAIADLSRYLQLHPQSDKAFNDRGLAYLRKGELDLALADFEGAIRVNPSWVVPRNNRALVFARQDKLEAAIAGYSEAIGVSPRNRLAHSNRGSAYEAEGHYDKALSDYKIASEGPLLQDTEENRQIKATAEKRLTRLQSLIAEGKATPKAMAMAERRVALVIANSAYEHVAALRNPANDGKALATALRGLNFEVREIYDVNLSGFGKVLKDFGDLAEGADWAVIYFAGHGLEIAGTNFLIPVDAKLELQRHVEDEAMPLSRVLGKVAGASKMQLVILDACRNNPFVTKMRQSGRATRAISSGLASIEPESGVLVAYAARDGTTAFDGESNSPYLEALVKHIGEPGLEINLLFRKIRDDVLTRTSRQQEPFTYGSLPAQPFFFKR